MDKCFLSSYPEILSHVTIWSTATGSTFSQDCHVATNITFHFIHLWAARAQGCCREEETKSPTFTLWHKLLSLEFTSNIDQNSLFIACPQEQMHKQGVMWTNSFKAFSHIYQNQIRIIRKTNLKTTFPSHLTPSWSVHPPLQHCREMGKGGCGQLITFQLLLPP